mmetsp:Transcript_100811/g.178875  ORF Transcript_100811/g.178875 Transcript_100811/m.178875 type:complete len:613 (-) Transcript_100811:437-2275(-)
MCSRSQFVLRHASSIDSRYLTKGASVLVGKNQSRTTVIVKARHLLTGAVRIIKVIPKGTEAMTEAFVHRRLDHPNVVRLFEIFEDEAQTYLAMEMCAGGSLADQLERCCELSESTAAVIMNQLLRAIRFLHKNSVCHNDITIDNVLFEKDDLSTQSLIKIADFGMARGEPFHVDIRACGYVMMSLLSCCGNGKSRKARPRSPQKATNPSGSGNQVLTVSKTGVEVNVSREARDLLQQLLEAVPSTRCSAWDALRHDWFRKHLPKAAPLKLPDSFLEKLSTFRAHCRFKKAALMIMADQLGSHTKEHHHVRELFLQLDTGVNGLLTPHQVKKGFRAAKLQMPDNLRRLMRAADPDGLGVMEYTTFQAVMLNSEMYTRSDACKVAFGIFDYDGDGSVSQSEIAHILWGVDVQGRPIKGSLAGFVDGVNQKGTNTVSFAHFMAMMRQKAVLDLPARSSEKQATATSVEAASKSLERNFLRKAKLSALYARKRSEKKKKVSTQAKTRSRQIVKGAMSTLATEGSDVANLEDFEEFSESSESSDEEEVECFTTEFGREPRPIHETTPHLGELMSQEFKDLFPNNSSPRCCDLESPPVTTHAALHQFSENTPTGIVHL